VEAGGQRPNQDGSGTVGRITGVRTYFGSVYAAPAVILTTGTFLGGQIWVGKQSMSAGRAGEQAAEGLTEALQALGFRTGRLKTGTPARVDPPPVWPWVSSKSSPATPRAATSPLIRRPG